MPAAETLYERLGGEVAVVALVDDFYERVLADELLRPFFVNASMDKLRAMQREFFSAALEGPVRYTGRPLYHTHFGRGIKRQHFARFVEHLFATLEDFPLSEDDRSLVIARVNTYLDEVVGGHGMAG